MLFYRILFYFAARVRTPFKPNSTYFDLLCGFVVLQIRDNQLYNNRVRKNLKAEAYDNESTTSARENVLMYSSIVVRLVVHDKSKPWRLDLAEPTRRLQQTPSLRNC